MRAKVDCVHLLLLWMYGLLVSESHGFNNGPNFSVSSRIPSRSIALVRPLRNSPWVFRTHKNDVQFYRDEVSCKFLLGFSTNLISGPLNSHFLPSPGSNIFIDEKNITRTQHRPDISRRKNMNWRSRRLQSCKRFAARTRAWMSRVIFWKATKGKIGRAHV